jgi:hypothetical protein
MDAWVTGWEKKPESRLDAICANEKVRALRMTKGTNYLKWNEPAMNYRRGRRVVITHGGQEGPD